MKEEDATPPHDSEAEQLLLASCSIRFPASSSSWSPAGTADDGLFTALAGRDDLALSRDVAVRTGAVGTTVTGSFDAQNKLDAAALSTSFQDKNGRCTGECCLSDVPHASVLC